MKSAENIKKLIKNTKIKTNPEVDKAVLNDLLNRMDHAGGNINTSQQNIWRMIMKSKITKFATAAVIIIAVIIGINQFGGPVDMASVAFADAMEHFVNTQTARFDLSIEFGEQEPQTSSFLYDAKGYIRQNMANGTTNFVDYNRNKVYSLVPDSKTVVIRDVRNPDFHTALYDIFTKLQELIQQAIDLGHGPVESLGTRNIDGHTAYGYCVETMGQSPGLDWQGKGTLTIWADAETDFPLILKWHHEMTNMTVTVSNICLNVIFRPDELSITIPDGYIVRDETLPVPEPEHEPDGLQEDIIKSDNIPEVLPGLPLLSKTPEYNIADLIEGLNKNEQNLIKFFYSWACLAKDKFPSSLTLDAIKDIDPDAKINFEIKLGSSEFSVNMPNLWSDWKPDIDPNAYTPEEIRQAADRQGPYYQELQKQFNDYLQKYDPAMDNIARGFMIIDGMPADTDWHYNGVGVSMGDSDTAIFWYKPNGAAIYRVIYGDLTIEDIDAKNLYLLEKPSDNEIDLQANAVLEAAIQLGADIPKDKRSKVFRMLSLKEKDLIKGLATYLEYSDGKYPPSMIINESFMKDIDTLLSEAVSKGSIDKKTSEEKVFELFYAGSFYDKLIREKKEPVYYGATSTISNPDDVLVRWKLSKNKYRVIYSGLKAETVTAEKLAELEKVLITE
jgi:outer membrane lipoprotein-sorting protein